METIKPSNFEYDIKVGDRVGLIIEGKNGKRVVGVKTPIVISKIKENGHIYLKGEDAPTSTPFKLNSKGKYGYTYNETFTHVDYVIIPLEKAEEINEAKRTFQLVKSRFDRVMSTPLTRSEMEAVTRVLMEMRGDIEP